MARKEFSTKDRHAIAILDYEPPKHKGKKCILVAVLSKKTANTLAYYEINSIDGVNSYTALMRACKDPSNQFCPLPVSCDVNCEKVDLQEGGNLPPPPVSSNSTAGGNLLFLAEYKDGSIVRFTKNTDFVLCTITAFSQTYKYPMTFEDFYFIKGMYQDFMDRYGYQLVLKRLIWLCKSRSYDRENANICVA